MRREREKTRERGANADAGETMAVCVTISWLPYRCRVRRSRLSFRISSSFSLLLCLVSYSQLLTSRNFVSICCRMRERKRARGYKEERRRWLAQDPEVDRKEEYIARWDRCLMWKKNRKKQPACFAERGSANDGTKKQRIETDQLASLPAQTAYRVWVSLNELANYS